MIATITGATVLLAVVGLVVGFVVGIIVGKDNKATVAAVTADVQKAVPALAGSTTVVASPTHTVTTTVTPVVPATSVVKA